MQNFSTLRETMVDTQVRPSDVTKFPIIDAMLSVPREAFLPDALRDVAYMGENIDLAPHRCVLEPRTIAKMLDGLNVEADELVLDIAPALGYSTALLAQLAEAVVAVESWQKRWLRLRKMKIWPARPRPIWAHSASITQP